MARAFSVTMPSTSISAAADLIRITCPTNFRLRILKATAGTGTSETSEKVLLGFYYATDNGTGTATNVVGLDGFSAQSDWNTLGGSCAVNLTVATTKSPTEPAIYRDADLAFGFEWEREEGVDWMDVPAGKRFVLRLDNAPSGATAITAQVVFEVI